jgi:N-acetylmuramoyl-L-alanine amidase
MDIARRNKADLFISVHADAVDDRRANGASVYALSLKGASDEAARQLADRENASVRVGGVSLEDKDEVLASVLLDLSQSAALSASLDFSPGQGTPAHGSTGWLPRAQVAGYALDTRRDRVHIESLRREETAR